MSSDRSRRPLRRTVLRRTVLRRTVLRWKVLRWKVRGALAVLAALLGVLAVALPAQAMTVVRQAGVLTVNGVPVEAVRWNSWAGPSGVSASASLTLDAAGGARYAGIIANGNIAGRHVRYRCTITYGPGDQITWSTSRYWIAGGTSKSWDWGRRTDDPRIQARWAEIRTTDRASCSVIIG